MEKYLSPDQFEVDPWSEERFAEIGGISEKVRRPNIFLRCCLMNSRPACMQVASIHAVSCRGYSSDGTLPYLMSMQVKTYARDTEATVKYMNDVKNVLAFVCMQHLCFIFLQSGSYNPGFANEDHKF